VCGLLLLASSPGQAGFELPLPVPGHNTPARPAPERYDSLWNWLSEETKQSLAQFEDWFNFLKQSTNYHTLYRDMVGTPWNKTTQNQLLDFLNAELAKGKISTFPNELTLNLKEIAKLTNTGSFLNLLDEDSKKPLLTNSGAYYLSPENRRMLSPYIMTTQWSDGAKNLLINFFLENSPNAQAIPQPAKTFILKKAEEMKPLEYRSTSEKIRLRPKASLPPSTQ